jgi:hypothetical protein
MRSTNSCAPASTALLALGLVACAAGGGDGRASSSGGYVPTSAVTGSVVTTVTSGGGEDEASSGVGGQGGAVSSSNGVATAGGGGASSPCPTVSEIFTFTDKGSMTVPTLVLGTLTVSGSAPLHLYAGSMGIQGGLDDAFVDGSESVEFTFESPATQIAYVANPVGNPNLDDFPGACTYEAFDENGASLGVVSSNASDFKFGQVSKLFGDLPIRRFRVKAESDYQGIASLTATFPSCP